MGLQIIVKAPTDGSTNTYMRCKTQVNGVANTYLYIHSKTQRNWIANKYIYWAVPRRRAVAYAFLSPNYYGNVEASQLRGYPVLILSLDSMLLLSLIHI